MFFERAIRDKGGGYCRRYAPRPVVAREILPYVTDAGKRHYQGSGSVEKVEEYILAGWPAVGIADWCGEHKDGP